MSANPYAAWVDWLTAFGRGEDRPATHLVAVTEELGPDMYARVLHRLHEAFVARHRLWVEALQRDIDTLPAALATHLVNARARLRPLVELTRSELLPEPERAALTEALTDAVRSTQDSLANDVRRDDALTAIVRDNDLTVALTAASRVDEPETGPTGRTIIWR
jgi:hypothetical protein